MFSSINDVNIKIEELNIQSQTIYPKMVEDKELREAFENFIAYLEEINNNNINFTDALLKLTEKEIEFKNERASKIQIAVSAFPFEKTLNDFEFDFQPSLNKAKIKDLETLRFLDNKENVLFYGNSGVGNYRKFYVIERFLMNT